MSQLLDLLRNESYTPLVENSLEVLVFSEVRRIEESDAVFAGDESFPAISAYITVLRGKTNELVTVVKQYFRRYEKFRTETASNDDNLNISNILGKVFHVMNLWRVHSKLCFHSDPYTNYVKLQFADVVAVTYSLFEISLRVFSFYENSINDTNDLEHLLSSEDVDRCFRALVDVLEMVVPICLRFCPFICTGTNECEVTETKIFKLLKHHIFGLNTLHEKHNDRLSIVANMMLNCCLWTSRINPQQRRYHEQLSTDEDEVASDSGESNNKSEDSESNSFYEADDESCNETDLFYSNDMKRKRCRNLTVIYYGELCRLLFEVLVEFSENDASYSHTLSIIAVCKRLLSLCRENEANSLVLYRNQIPYLILNGFRRILMNSEIELLNVQNALLDLFLEMCCFKIDGIILKAFLSLMKCESSPLTVLIPALLQLVTTHHISYSHKATHYLIFPADPLLSISGLSDSWINQYRIQSAVTTNESSMSSWYTAAICIPLPKQTSSLLSTNKCFAIAFWASFETDDENTKCGKRARKNSEANFHVISITLDSICIEIWLNSELNQLKFKIVKIINGKFLVSESSKQICINDEWHLFCFNFSEIILKKNMVYLNVSYIINGFQEESFALHCSIPKNVNCSSILIGHTRSISTVMHFGNLFFFKNSLSLESFLYLYCNGPDFSDFTRCHIDESQRNELIVRTMNSFVSTTFLEAYMNSNSVNALSNLRRNVLLVYNVCHFEYALHYMSINVTAPFSSFFRQSSYEKELQQVYKVMVYKFSNLKCDKISHLPSALTEIGGIGAFLFLFAKVVEDCDNELLHSNSLLILLKTCEINNELMNNFIRDFDGFQMINAVLQSPKCRISANLLNAYLSCCLSNNLKDATIISPTAFLGFVQCWKAWHLTPATSNLFYSVLEKLIDEENPNSPFNLKQMKQLNIFQLVLSISQDNYSWLLEKNTSLPEIAVEVIPKILYRMSTTPIDLSLINDLMNCILLLHNASKAYICYTKNSFYYCMAAKSLNPPENIFTSAFDDWNIIGSDFEDTLPFVANNLSSFLSNVIGIISKMVALIPEAQLNSVFMDIIKPEFIAVLLHNDNSLVRESCIKLISNCLRIGRNTDAIRQFTAKKGYHLFSNQLHQHSATGALVNTVFAMLLDMKNEFNLEEMIFQEVEKDRWPSFILLFSLIPNSVLDKSLCHNSLKALHQLIRITSFSSPLLKYLFDNGIIECLLKTIVNFEEQSSGEDESGYDDNLIHSDVFDIIYSLSKLFFNSNGTLFFHCYCNVLDVISHFERMLSTSLGPIFRECQIRVLESAFDTLEYYINSHKLDGSQRWNSKLSLGSLKSEYFLNLLHVAESNCNLETPMLLPDETPSTSSMSVSIYGNGSPDEGNVRLSESELTERFCYLLNKSTEFIMKRKSFTNCSPSILCYLDYDRNTDNKRELYFERTFIDFLVTSFDYYYIRYLKNRFRTFWYSVLSSSKDVLKTNLGQCVVFLLSCVDSQEEASFVSTFVTRHLKILQIVPKLHQKVLLPMECFLKDLIAFKIPIEEIQSIESLLKTIEDIRTKKRIQFKCYKEVISDWFVDLDKYRQSRKKLSSENEARTVARIDDLTATVTEYAMSATRDFVEAQYRERKQFFNYIKQTNSLNFAIKKAWSSLITTFYHERSVWFYKQAFPQHWELDPTEGPLRIRRRLRRCFLNVDKKFFRNNCELRERKNLLSYLFAKNKFETDSSAFIDRIHTNERIMYTSPCLVVTPAEEYPGEILIGSCCIHFVGEQRNSNSNSSVITEFWMFEEIKEVKKCRFQLQDNAIEMFLTNGQTYLIAFETKPACDEFLSSLTLSRNLTNLVVDKSLLEVTQLWRERRITNFEYLTYLNKLAGRSFNDLMQYPVFPFVLSDYESYTLDLRSESSFRKLNRPMAVQKKSKEEYYINQYNYLKTEYENNQHIEELMVPTTGPYHFGSHYSNSGTVLHFLVRLPPFTQMFLQYQDNNFDIPDRTFHSMGTSWRLSSGDSTTDFKELIPEFFFLPEFLINSENFDFGVRQNNEVVDNVKLSNWCRNDPRIFILIHRQALESDFVTEHLNEWIDLVFGFQQSGKAAIEAINVFHPATYYGINASQIKDPLKRKALQTMIKTYGQMPKKLFAYPHPKIYSKVQREVQVRQVIGEVIGLKWGSYVFSPSEPEPFNFKKNRFSKIASLVPVITNEIFGLVRNSCLMISYSKHKGGALANATYITDSYVVSWNHDDSVVRIKFQRDMPSFPLLSTSSVLDKVSICGSAIDLNLLVIGYESGSLAVYAFKRPLKMGTVVYNSSYCVKRLVGHSGAVSALCVSKEFSVAVSGGKDGNCLLWDLNKYCYVRTITDHNSKIKLLAISQTLGDIVSVSDFDHGSTLKVNTINGAIVGHIKTEEVIEAICYSSSPEGISVNVIATGFSNGTIKLWSSWDLSSVRVISIDQFTKPIKCITFSTDNQSFYAINSEGTLVIWTKDREKISSLFPHLLTF